MTESRLEHRSEHRSEHRLEPPLAPRSGAAQQRRAFWLKHLHQWHWISSALCLIGMLLFAVTGFTLNHASQIEAEPKVVTRQAEAPAPVLAALKARKATLAGDNGGTGQDKTPVPAELADWLQREFDIDAHGREAEWSADELYVPLPRPGGDAWVSVALDSGETQYELTTRGWISYLNDLHKGRNTGGAWSLFLDVFAFACLVFCVTGLFLLKLHAGGRVATWPLVGLGLVAPLLLAILFIH
ncbi:PepSY-associated TM helix domain-containing protein [Cupriavidus gilardii]|nr:PepSY-associated TM helix domain-containing protein [Cupriavidus gilardii]MCG5261946.1 PepSY-associated TM helix domain-containing protein [Cupriavidus gilardii]